MSEPAHLGGTLACGTITPLAAVAVLARPGETLPAAAVLRGVQLIAAGPVRFAAVCRPCPPGHLAVRPISQP